MNNLKKIFNLLRQNYKHYSGAAILILVFSSLPIKAYAFNSIVLSGIAIALGPVMSWITGIRGNIFSITIEVLYTGFASIIFAWSVIISSITGYVADFFINYALQSTFYDLPGITLGWAISRDVANLFFIFIFLAIAIATILRYESYGAKALLPKLLIVALLINFSLPISRTIIEASNLLAIKFYDGIAENPQLKEAAGSAKEESRDAIKVSPISTTINAIVGMQTILDPGFASNTEVTQIKDKDRSMAEIGTVLLGGSAVLLTLSFVMGALAVLFLIRIIVLAFVLILAPLGFLAMILPYTQKYASEWWGKLFSQSFFAPFALMMLYISISLLRELRISVTTLSKSSFAAAVTGTGSIDIIFNFVLVIGLLIGSLIVAQKLGVMGALTAIAWGQSAYKGARGYAGRQTYGRAAVALEKKYGDRMKAISPTLSTALSGGLKGIGSGYAKSVEARVANITSIKDAGLRLKGLSNLSASEQTAAWKKMSKQQKAEMRSLPEDTQHKKIVNQLTEKDEEKERGAAKARAEAAISGALEKQDIAKRFAPMNIIELQVELAKGANADQKKIAELTGEMTVIGKNLKEIVQTLEAVGNARAANILKTSPAKIALDAILRAQKPPEKSGGTKDTAGETSS